jgi:hypothetical protein
MTGLFGPEVHAFGTVITYREMFSAMTGLHMTPIASSMFDSHNYDPDSRVLTVQFKNGATYQHADVPADKFEAFVGAASPGQFYNARIQPNHPGTKV